MSYIVETVGSVTIPATLTLRLVTGEAARVLAVLEQSGDLPPGGDRALSEAALALQASIDTAATPTVSLAMGEEEPDLFSIATNALQPDGTDALEEELGNTAAKLKALAEGKSLKEDQVAVLRNVLQQIQTGLSAERSEVTDIYHHP